MDADVPFKFSLCRKEWAKKMEEKGEVEDSFIIK
jgi:hypothetical protein